MYGVLLLIVAAVLISGGQLMFKLAASNGNLPQRGIVEFAIQAVAQPYLWFGGLFAGLGFAVYLYGLRAADLSKAVPLAGGLIIAFSAILSALLLREQISVGKAAGMALVVAGVFLVARG